MFMIKKSQLILTSFISKMLSVQCFLFIVLCVLLNFISITNTQIISKPNIIIIVADDLGWNDVSFHGSNQVPTPNIDALAYSGVILNNYYTLPLCTPSRSALMTGKHPIHTGMQSSVIIANEPWGLGLEEKLLPQYLKEEGYATHSVGKWHLGYFHKEYTPTFRGYDSHFGYWTGFVDYYDYVIHSTYWGHDLRENMTVTKRGLGEYATRVFTQEAEKLISEHDTSRPMFLYFGQLAVHSANPYKPLEAPQETIDKFENITDPKRRIFAAMLTELDYSVGAVVAALRDRGMLENSIIIFTTDNGGCPAGYEDSAASNWPLRGIKNSLWEGGVHGAAFIWSPLLQNTPRVSSQLTHIQDWLPTLMSAIAANVTLGNLDGVDLWPALNNPELNTYETLLINIDDREDRYALRMGDWKIIKGGAPNSSFDYVFGPSGRDGKNDLHLVQESDVANALESIGHPLPSSEDIMRLRNEAMLDCDPESVEWTCLASEGETCLFDVNLDPCESRDLTAEHPDVVSAMLQLLADYNATAVSPRKQPLDPNSNPAYWNYSWTNWADYPPPLVNISHLDF